MTKDVKTIDALIALYSQSRMSTYLQECHQDKEKAPTRSCKNNAASLCDT